MLRANTPCLRQFFIFIFCTLWVLLILGVLIHFLKYTFSWQFFSWLLAKGSVEHLLRPEVRLFISSALQSEVSCVPPCSGLQQSFSLLTHPCSVKGSPARRKRDSASYSAEAKPRLTSGFVNNILLEHKQAHSFAACLWLLSRHCVKSSGQQ